MNTPIKLIPRGRHAWWRFYFIALYTLVLGVAILREGPANSLYGVWLTCSDIILAGVLLASSVVFLFKGQSDERKENRYLAFGGFVIIAFAVFGLLL